MRHVLSHHEGESCERGDIITPVYITVWDDENGEITEHVAYKRRSML